MSSVPQPPLSDQQLNGKGLGREPAASTGSATEASEKTTKDKDEAQAQPSIALVATKPDIIIKEAEIARMCDELEAAAVSDPDQALFKRGKHLVRVVPYQDPDSGLPRVCIDDVDIDHLREIASSVATWQKWVAPTNGSKAKAVPTLKETKAPDYLLNSFIARRAWKALKSLRAVTQVPTLRPDGTILDKPGYDEASRIYFQPFVKFPPVASTPTRDDAIKARDLLLDYVCDFKFVDDADKSAWLSLILTVVGRGCIDGPTPMFLLGAPSAGQGKNLLLDAASCAVNGDKVSRYGAYPNSQKEEREILYCVAKQSSPLTLFDNLDPGRPLDSPVLASFLTSTSWQNRVFYSQDTAQAPISTVICATGNNVIVQGDMIRRVLEIRIDRNADVSGKPDESNYKHPDLETEVAAARPQLVAAALTILRAFFVAGRPSKLKALPSYGAWNIIRDALAWIDMKDPAETLRRTADRPNAEREAVYEVLSLWLKQFAAKPMTMRAALNEGEYGLKLALATLYKNGDPANLNPVELGKRFSTLIDSWQDDLVLRQVKEKTKSGALWLVEAKPGSATDASARECRACKGTGKLPEQADQIQLFRKCSACATPNEARYSCHLCRIDLCQTCVQWKATSDELHAAKASLCARCAESFSLAPRHRSLEVGPGEPGEVSTTSPRPHASTSPA